MFELESAEFYAGVLLINTHRHWRWVSIPVCFHLYLRGGRCIWKAAIFSLEGEGRGERVSGGGGGGL